MNLILLNAALAPFLALAAAPLVIHLLAKGRPPEAPFSSVEFILRAVRSSMRLKRPQDYLLLALRTLAFAAAILLFLQPVLFLGGRAAGMFQRNNVVVVLDSSASMACVEGGQTRFAAACAEASALLSGLGSRDTANIVWLNARPSSVFPEMGVNFAFLKGELQKAKVSSGAGRAGEAVSLAAGLLRGLEGRKEICIVSDFQRSAWKDVVLDIPEGVEIVKVKVGSADAPNVSVASLSCEPGLPLAGEEAMFHCEVRNYSGQPRRTEVFFGIQESRSSQEAVIPANGRLSLTFKHRFMAPGVFVAKASISEDSFHGDDERLLCVNVRQGLRVGICKGEPATAAVWKRALDSLPWAMAEFVDGGDLSGELPFDILMLSSWDGSGMDRLAARLGEGMSIVCMPSPSLDWAAISKLVGGSVDPRLQDVQFRKEARGPGEPWRLKISKPDDPAFKLFSDGEMASPVAGLSYGRMLLPRWEGGGDVLLSFDDGAPALVRLRKGGAGQLLVWDMPLGRESSTWMSQPGFLPFLSELLLSSRGSSVGAGEPERLPGDQLVLSSSSDAIAGDISLRDEAGDAIPLDFRKGAARSLFVSEPISSPGLYFWRNRGRDSGVCAVNFPSVESDLATMPPELAGRTSDSISLGDGGEIKRIREGLSLWPSLLCAALAFLLLEGACSLWAESGWPARTDGKEGAQ